MSSTYLVFAMSRNRLEGFWTAITFIVALLAVKSEMRWVGFEMCELLVRSGE